MAWVIIRKQLVCVMSVYRPQTGRTEEEKQEFRYVLEMMIGMVELETLHYVLEETCKLKSATVGLCAIQQLVAGTMSTFSGSWLLGDARVT